MSDTGIEQYLQAYQRTETAELVKVTEDNLMMLARALGATISFDTLGAVAHMDRGHNLVTGFRIGDLIDMMGQKAHGDWTPVETGDLINGGDLR